MMSVFGRGALCRLGGKVPFELTLKESILGLGKLELHSLIDCESQ